MTNDHFDNTRSSVLGDHSTMKTPSILDLTRDQIGHFNQSTNNQSDDAAGHSVNMAAGVLPNHEISISSISYGEIREI